MVGKLSLQDIEHTVPHIDEVRIRVEFPDILLNDHLPLTRSVGNLRHLRLPGDHLRADHVLGGEVGDPVVHTVLIAVELLRRVEHGSILRKVISQDIRKELHALIGDRVPCRELPRGCLPRLVRRICGVLLVQCLLHDGHRSDISHSKMELVLQLMVEDSRGNSRVHIEQAVMDERIDRRDILHHVPRDREVCDRLLQGFHAHRLIALRRRCLAPAGAVLHLRALPSALLSKGRTGDRSCLGLKEVADLLIRLFLRVSRVLCGQLVDLITAAFEHGEVGDHSVPQELRQLVGVIVAVLHELTGADHIGDTRLRPFHHVMLLCPVCRRVGLLVLRERRDQLFLCVPAFRMELHEMDLIRCILLAVVEPRETHHTARVHDLRITMEVVSQCLLHGTEEPYLRTVLHQPVHMQALLRLHDHRRWEREGIDVLLLFFLRKVIGLDELGVDTPDVLILVAACIDNGKDAASLSVMFPEQGFHRLELFHRLLDLRSGKRRAFFIREHTVADRITRLVKRTDHVFCVRLHVLPPVNCNILRASSSSSLP